MAVFGRRLRPPAALRSLLGPNERLLAMAEDGPAAVGATQFGLWLPAEPGWRRIDWDQVVKASWTEDGLYLIEGVRDSDGVVTDLPALTLRLAEPRNLPAVVKTRVEASIARWEQVRVPGGTGRIVARRKPGVDGLVWTARLDTGTPDSAQARDVLVGHLIRLAEPAPEELYPT